MRSAVSFAENAPSPRLWPDDWKIASRPALHSGSRSRRTSIDSSAQVDAEAETGGRMSKEAVIVRLSKLAMRGASPPLASVLFDAGFGVFRRDFTI